jgi:hypothetical protein
VFDKEIERWKGGGTLVIDRTNLLKEDRKKIEDK